MPYAGDPSPRLGIRRPLGNELHNRANFRGVIDDVDLGAAKKADVDTLFALARGNQLVNGGFERWDDRGTGPFTVSTAYFAYRWQILLAGTDTMSVSQTTAAANKKPNSKAAAAVTFTLGTGGGASAVRQVLRIGTDDYHHLLGKPFSLTLSVKTAVAAGCRFGIDDGVNPIAYSAYHSGGGAFEELTATLAAVSTASTALVVYIYFAATGTYYLDNAMGVPQSVPADFQGLTPSEELARCQRYMEVWGGDHTNEPMGTGVCTGASAGYMFVPFKVKKAVAASISVSNVAHFTFHSGPVAGNTNALNHVAQTSTGWFGTWGSAVTTFTSGHGGIFYANTTACRLYAEANP
jgi:hypothetical protein